MGPDGPHRDSGVGPAGGRETGVPATCHLPCPEERQEVTQEVRVVPARWEPVLSWVEEACSVAFGRPCIGNEGSWHISELRHNLGQHTGETQKEPRQSWTTEVPRTPHSQLPRRRPSLPSIPVTTAFLAGQGNAAECPSQDMSRFTSASRPSLSPLNQ